MLFKVFRFLLIFFTWMIPGFFHMDDSRIYLKMYLTIKTLGYSLVPLRAMTISPERSVLLDLFGNK